MGYWKIRDGGNGEEPFFIPSSDDYGRDGQIVPSSMPPLIGKTARPRFNLAARYRATEKKRRLQQFVQRVQKIARENHLDITREEIEDRIWQGELSDGGAVPFSDRQILTDLRHPEMIQAETMRRKNEKSKQLKEYFSTKIWKTINLGELKTSDGAKRALVAANCRIGGGAAGINGVNEILNHTVYSSEKIAVNLIALSVADLKSENTTIKDVMGSGRGLGLASCPAEVGPALRTQYCDQQDCEQLIVAMEPMLVYPPEYFYGVFSILNHKDILYLSTKLTTCYDGYVRFSSKARFVFCLNGG